MLTAFLWPLAVVAVWVIIFWLAFFLSRKGVRERDSETRKLAEAEDEAIKESGWKPLHP